MRLVISLIIANFLFALPATAKTLEGFFAKEKLSHRDAILVVKEDEGVLFSQGADEALIPASLTKLATAYVAIEKWGIDKRFRTEFYRDQDTLLVKGFGDPFLVSEELDLIASELKKIDVAWVRNVAIDASYFKQQLVPGRTRTADPYNAPLSALSANFNTAMLSNNNGRIVSAEPQTPITQIAVNAATELGVPKIGKTERINLLDASNAQFNFGELLVAKLGLADVRIELVTSLPDTAQLILDHHNSRNLADVIQGALEYSNNFIANQLFLTLSESPQVDFRTAADDISAVLKQQLGWNNFAVTEGSGLSRENRLSAHQIDALLARLSAHKGLFKSYDSGFSDVTVRAKTGTLDGIRSFAGFINIKGEEYRFVFNFNRATPYKYRDQLLRRLVGQLVQTTQ